MSIYHAAAQRLLADQAACLPDLSGITILVPHYHVVRPFLSALRQAVEWPVFLPPRFLSLSDAAASVARGIEFQTDSQRLVALHGFLTRVAWLEASALWPVAWALLDLLNELDDAKLVPPQDYADFSRQIERAARGQLSRPLDQEARLVFELWRAFHEAGPGRRAGYAANLARWLDQHAGPVYSLGLAGLTGMESHFLAVCRERLGLSALPVDEPDPERRALLDTVWRPRPGSGPLLERARSWQRGTPVSPLQMELVGAPDMESEALTVASRIRSWLLQGRTRIAVIALDRLAARRLRAVLERDRILMQDETGWTFATATVSHVLDRWFALVQGNCYHRDLLDLLKSPFVCADLDQDARLSAVAALERQIVRHQAVAGLHSVLALAVGEAALAHPLLERIASALEAFQGNRRRTLTGWLEALFATLEVLAAQTAMAADQAGQQLLKLLQGLSVELAGDRSLHSLTDWRGWLDMQLDHATFVADDIESPICLTHLAAARLRDFEAVVVLGADAAHLPPTDAQGLFSQAMRAQLGLPGQGREDVLDVLIDVLVQTQPCLITWQARQADEANALSPWLELLQTFHELAYGDKLLRPAVTRESGQPDLAIPENTPARLHNLPDRLSASAWQSLLDCPYQYFARYGLALNEAGQVSEAMAKADYGERVHAILSRFHATYPILLEPPRSRLESELMRITEAVFEADAHWDYLAQAWRMRWSGLLSEYLDWAIARERAGFAWQASERACQTTLNLPGAQALACSVNLQGRIDRIDLGPDGLVVLDYKTQSRSALRNKLKAAGEYAQLAFYGLLTGAVKSGLVALDDDKIDVVEMQQPFAEMVKAEETRLRTILAAVASGAALPAHGAQATCQYCEMRGLCRRN